MCTHINKIKVITTDSGLIIRSFELVLFNKSPVPMEGILEGQEWWWLGGLNGEQVIWQCLLPGRSVCRERVPRGFPGHSKFKFGLLLAQAACVYLPASIFPQIFIFTACFFIFTNSVLRADFSIDHSEGTALLL